MAQKPSEERKIDLSSLPRGAIGIKGLPISRNTRLPSIRSPRDLTLGAPPKRTFVPNIPPRRDKKHQTSPDNKPTSCDAATSSRLEKKSISPQTDWSKGRGRGKKQIIQTEGSVFGEGIAENSLSQKEKIRESYQKSDYVASSKSTHVKKEKMELDVAGVNRKMDELFRDDFLDNDDDDITLLSKPIIFPKTDQIKKETHETVEAIANFNPDVAKDVGFDVNHVTKFIKKEKDMDTVEKESPVSTDVPPNELLVLLNEDTPQLLLLQFPKVVTLFQKMDDSSPEKKGQVSDPKPSEIQKSSSTSISSLPEGHIGKLQVMKSGKTRLLIGSLSFDLDSMSTLRSRHEVVSIRTNSESGDLSVLGYMGHKFTFAPNVNSLLS